MRKIYLFAGLAAMMLASCSSNDKLDSSPTPQQPDVAAAGEIPVGFDAYAYRGITRAGQTGPLDNTALRNDWAPGAGTPTYGGFGVFGYYTDNNDYDQLATPNFFYNQLVTYNTTYWSYEPVKYWPNEYGDNAISDDADRVSFFAYAPYVEVNPANGKPTANNQGDASRGITQLSRNTASGDPIVKYISSFDAATSVDLCWGINEQNTWTTVNGGQQQTFTAGVPWLDVQRPASAGTQAAADATSRVKFTFRHALAKMQVKIDAFIDGYDATNALENETKIWVRSIRFNGLAMKGALNLNNENPYQPYWLNYNGVGDLEADGDVVVYDGRNDGKEGMENAKATNEKSLGLNPNLIQKEGYVTNPGEDNAAWNGSAIGVTKNPVDLFAGGGIFYVIPVADQTVEVEIVYDVETIDKNLANTISDGKTKGSSIENRITKAVSFGSVTSLEAGKGYTINLHLGMNSVKLDAEVKDWEDMSPGTEVDLPANLPVYSASTTPGTKVSIDIPGYDGTAVDYTYNFAVRGFVGGEAITPTAGAILTAEKVYSSGAKLVTGGAGDNMANASGIAYISTTAKAYTKVVNDAATDDIVLTGLSGANIQLTVTRLAVKLGLYEPATKTAPAAAPYTMVLQRNYTGVAEVWTDAATGCPALSGFTPGVSDNNYIRVWRNGAELVYNATPAADNEFSFDNTTGTITFQSAIVAGDKIKVSIKCGNVAEETISFDIE